MFASQDQKTSTAELKVDFCCDQTPSCHLLEIDFKGQKSMLGALWASSPDSRFFFACSWFCSPVECFGDFKRLDFRPLESFSAIPQVLTLLNSLLVVGSQNSSPKRSAASTFFPDQNSYSLNLLDALVTFSLANYRSALDSSTDGSQRQLQFLTTLSCL